MLQTPRSSLRHGGLEIGKKRLSFAKENRSPNKREGPRPKKKRSMEDGSRRSGLESSHHWLQAESSVKKSAFGTYYKPKSPESRKKVNVDPSSVKTTKITPLTRPDFRFLFRQERDPVNVLVVGERCLCTEFSTLIKARSSETPKPKNLVCNIVEEPSAEELGGADFVLFAIQMEKIFSVRSVSSVVENILKESHSNSIVFRSAFLLFSSPKGSAFDVTTQESYKNLTYRFQIPHLIFRTPNKNQKKHVVDIIYQWAVDSASGEPFDTSVRWGFSISGGRWENALTSLNEK